MGRIIQGAATFLVLSGFYLFLAGTVDSVELIAMFACAAVGTILAVALTVVAKRHYAPLPPPRAILRPIGALPLEFLVVGRELASVALVGATRQRGSFAQQRFEPGVDVPRDAARRALTVIGISLAPRAFVVRGERSGELLLHSMPQKTTSSDAMWPA